MVMKIYLKKVDGVTPPERGSALAAGYDIVATSGPRVTGIDSEGVICKNVVSPELNKYRWKSVDYVEYETNLFIAHSVLTYHTLIHPRSSISKYNLVLANSIGLVDNDYRGMIICRFKYVWQPEDWVMRSTQLSKTEPPFFNGHIAGRINFDKMYKKGDKIAQLVFGPTVQVEFELCDELQTTQRGTGGFGSSGI